MSTQTLTVCTGKINSGGYCDKCYQVAQNTSNTCIRLIPIEQSMTKNEIVQENILKVITPFLGWEYEREYISSGTYSTKYGIDYETLHEAWVKFRDLKFINNEQRIAHETYSDSIAIKIAYGTITEAF